MRASKDAFYKDINLLVWDEEKQGKSGKENSAANDLVMSEEINKEKMKE